MTTTELPNEIFTTESIYLDYSEYPDDSYPDYNYTDYSYPDYNYTDYSYPDYNYTDYSYPDYNYTDYSYADYNYTDSSEYDYNTTFYVYGEEDADYTESTDISSGSFRPFFNRSDLIPPNWNRARPMPRTLWRSVPFGVLHDSKGTSAKKRCRCIEKKRKKVVKVIKYIPLSPSIRLPGNNRNFTCKCSHLRKVVKKSKPRKGRTTKTSCKSGRCKGSQGKKNKRRKNKRKQNKRKKNKRKTMKPRLN